MSAWPFSHLPGLNTFGDNKKQQKSGDLYGNPDLPDGDEDDPFLNDAAFEDE